MYMVYNINEPTGIIQEEYTHTYSKLFVSMYEK
jgi:hypothetical protein